MTLLKVPAGGAFDHLNCQHIGYFDQNFSKRSNVCSLPRGAGGGCLAVGMGSFGIDQKYYIMIPDIQHRALRLHQRFTTSNKPNQSLML